MQLIHAQYDSPNEVGKRGFEDLECYKLALDLVVNVHELARRIPAEEKYDLVAQIRRSSKSITANIAEGYGRYHYLDRIRFYTIARGELNETIAHLINANVLHYVEREYFEQVYKLARQTEAALNGFINYVRRQREGSKEFGDSYIRDEGADNYLNEYVETEDAR
jgi:four helix bundle protein